MPHLLLLSYREDVASPLRKQRRVELYTHDLRLARLQRVFHLVLQVHSLNQINPIITLPRLMCVRARMCGRQEGVPLSR